ncbi:baseplate J/gp47 family protein [Paraburkholderia lycopersici]|uniref:Phage-related baseplate assembly protein n=1 Tax=Paraburkholderia lycopersici TaxID=416944 RepID=A0A1G7CQM6_9BURK|nr:baseplate J/gp47 family protein [Paraburkholderia lycopersici]SDE41724.1 Phage-related baseplate assembly protein [Paraburkholderia lycopersici]
MTASAIDLSLLPAPAVVELLEFETLYAERKAALIALYPADEQATVAATLELESEPLAVSLQENTYRELILRTRVNDACYAVLLAFAMDGDLDQVTANLGVERLTITPADDTTTPPTAAVKESNTDLRKRAQLSFQGYTTAGSKGSYVYHALSADGQVKDASAVSPAPCQVMVYVLSRTGNGAADDALIAKVKAALNDEIVRPMTDQVDVQSASIIEYAIAAELVLQDGPDASTVKDLAQAAAQAYADATHMNGADVALSGIFKALHQTGVAQVNLTTPAANIVVSEGQAAYCIGITITTTVQSNV